MFTPAPAVGRFLVAAPGWLGRMPPMTEIRPVAHARTDFPAKFGIPRQAGLVPELVARIVFVPEFRTPDAVRGIDGFSHLWLVWGFSGVERDGWSPVVRPPRLGGDVRVGVFASRSPFRPIGLGLSSVHADATLGFTATNADYGVEVDLPDTLAVLVPADKLAALVGVLAQDPRPAVGRDPERVHGVEFAGLNVRFRVARGVLHVVEVHPLG